MDKKTDKDQEYFASNENIKRVHVQVGISEKNFKTTYIENKNGKDKHLMTEALSKGAMLMEHHISNDEVQDGIAFVLTKRQLSGIC